MKKRQFSIDWEELVMTIMFIGIGLCLIGVAIGLGVMIYEEILKISLLKQYGPEVVESVVNWLGK